MAEEAAKPVKTRLRIQISKDLEVVTITFPTAMDGRSRDVALPLNAHTIDSLLHGLGLLRAKMLAKHPHRRPQGETVSALRNPAFMTWPDPLSGQPVLSVHHSSFGWLSFAFSKESAMKIGKALQTYAALSPPQSPALKN